MNDSSLAGRQAMTTGQLELDADRREAVLHYLLGRFRPIRSA